MTPAIGPEIPLRIGHAPRVSTSGRIEQVTQCSPVPLQQLLLEMVAALPGVRIGPTGSCVPGSRGCRLVPALALGPARAFLLDTEFGHLHPVYDGSLHLRLPSPLAGRAVAAGWAVAAEPAGSLLVYGPRDESELDVAWQLLLAAYRQAAPGRAPAAPEGDPSP